LLQEIAERFGTPAYVYDLEVVDRQLERLRLAVPEARVHYAVKANPCGAILKHLAGRDLGAEVITLGELERALVAGYKPERIVVSGPAQSEAMIGRALEAGVRFVSLDSPSQLSVWDEHESEEVGFLPRLNPALDPGTHEHLATGAAASKFWMPLKTVLEVAERLGGRLAGFHVHAGSQIEEVGVYDEILAQLRELYGRFSRATALDIGGGFAVPNFPLEAFATRVRGFAKGFGLKLVVEPGRYLVAAAGVLVCRVLHVKEGPVKHAITDAGMAELIRPALYGAAHPIRLLDADADVGERPLERVDVDGPLCENADYLGRGCALASPRRGDLLVLEQAGAYGFTMASNYGSSLRPAEVVVRGEDFWLARAREEVGDLLRPEQA
jgi:diaminopimelate decarboxylase